MLQLKQRIHPIIADRINGARLKVNYRRPRASGNVDEFGDNHALERQFPK